MDLVAGLHWLRENLPAFNGDGNKITVMGHGTGAALANILVVSPVASGKFHISLRVYVSVSVATHSEKKYWTGKGGSNDKSYKRAAATHFFMTPTIPEPLISCA